MSISQNLHMGAPAVSAQKYQNLDHLKDRGYLTLSGEGVSLAFHSLTPDQIIDLGERIIEAGAQLKIALGGTVPELELV